MSHNCQKSATIEYLGLRIRKLRMSKGMSQKQLAYKVGLTKSYISLLETGKRAALISTLEKIATVLDTKLDIIFR